MLFRSQFNNAIGPKSALATSPKLRKTGKKLSDCWGVVSCDFHTWMQAFVYVFPHELFDVTAADGRIIPAGGHTVDNHFDFSNASARIGLDQQFAESWAFQLGVRMRSYSYRMEQEDYVLGLERTLTQQWTEWTPSWGVSYDLGGIELRYIGLASAAGHFPFPDFDGNEVWLDAPVMEADGLLGGDILAPPAGGLATPDQTTITHRLQISLPIR